MMNIKVLYEDNHIIAVVKPAGVLTQGDSSGEESLYDMVKDYIRIKKGKPLPGNACPARNSQPAGRFPVRSAGVVSSGVFLGLVHRLDKPVHLETIQYKKHITQLWRASLKNKKEKSKKR